MTPRQRTKTYGKKIEDLTYRINGKDYAFELRLLKVESAQFMYSAYHLIQEAVTAGNCTYGESSILQQNTDVNAVVKAMRKRLKDTYKVEWVQYVHICVASPGERTRGHTLNDSLGISIGCVLVGTREDGTQCYKEGIDTGEEGWKFWGSVNNGLPATGQSKNSYDRDHYYGLVPYSENTWGRLTQIIDALETIRERVQGFLTGDNPQAILANIHNTKMLTAPDGEEQE